MSNRPVKAKLLRLTTLTIPPSDDESIAHANHFKAASIWAASSSIGNLKSLVTSLRVSGCRARIERERISKRCLDKRFGRIRCAIVDMILLTPLLMSHKSGIVEQEVVRPFGIPAARAFVEKSPVGEIIRNEPIFKACASFPNSAT